MKSIRKEILLAIALVVFTLRVFSQEGWDIDKSKDGTITVKSKIERVDEMTVMRYTVSSKGNFSKEEAIKFLSNSANHQKFWENCSKSSEIKRMSDSEWYTYTYFDGTWPISDSDCAQHYTLSNTSNTVIVKGVTAPNSTEDKGVQRSELFDTLFEIEEISENSSTITLTVSFGSSMNLPKWIMNAWFPDGPIGIMERLKENLEK